MSLIQRAFNRHMGYVRRYPITVALLAACCVVIFIVGYQDKTLLHSTGYIIASWLGCFITDIVVLAKPKESIGFPVKKPVGQELWMIGICTGLGITFLLVRAFTDWNHMSNGFRLAMMPLLLFMFPIVPAVIMLFRYRYKPKELGVNVNYWYLPIVLHLMWGAMTFAVAPQQSHWGEMYKEMGVFGALFTGLITAALPEEFFRLLFMTRVGKASGSMAFGLFFATALWAAMHIPVDHWNNHMAITPWNCVQVVAFLTPIGMFWGYLTIRTKSLFSSVMMHGFNLWGLQNF